MTAVVKEGATVPSFPLLPFREIWLLDCRPSAPVGQNGLIA
jgi:hypothetical protein